MTECPRRLVTPDVVEMHTSFQHYRAGFLPVRGAMLDQAHTFTVAVRLLDSLYGMHERIETEKPRGR